MTIPLQLRYLRLALFYSNIIKLIFELSFSVYELYAWYM